MNKQRKNKIPRLLSLALMLTLITTCLLSGTLAKYVVTASGNDSARVAQLKFAGTLTGKDETGTAIGSTSANDFALFKTAYVNGESNTTISEVASVTSDPLNTSSLSELIAPGIKGSVLFDVSGMTEVTINLGLTITETQTNAASGTTIPIFYEYAGKYYTNDTTYLGMMSTGQILLDLSNTQASNDGIEAVGLSTANYGGTLIDLAADLAAAVTGAAPGTTTVPAGTTFSTPAGGLEVTWCWPFEVYQDLDADGTITAGDVLVSDTRDTALGTALSQTTPLAIDYIKLDIAATATQVD